MKNLSSFGLMVNELQKTHKIPVKDIATVLCKSPTTINRYKSDYSKLPSCGVIKKLSEFYSKIIQCKTREEKCHLARDYMKKTKNVASDKQIKHFTVEELVTEIKKRGWGISLDV
ncbi:MAG: hypothetical protein KAQ85_01340 [Thermodesulfovibrionia bacterium]|nr:hypothetical protein [Thermodesulfovibrionia bacterium]